jgi:peptidoglycan-associated lipoprotein
VAADRIRVISYGKEKPFCTESNEECWQLNRRAGFALDR